MSVKKFIFILLINLSCLCSISFANEKINIQTWSTQQGTPLYFVHSSQLPIIDIIVAFNAGSGRDGQHPGLANLTANLIGQGTTTSSADQIAEQFDSLGALFNTTVNRDMAVISLRSLTKPNVLNQGITAFIQTLSQANFPKVAFDRVKANTLQTIAQQLQDPSYVAGISFYHNVFTNSSYATPIMGTPTAINSITQINVIDFYKKYYVTKNAVITIVGDISYLQAKKIAAEITAALPVGIPASPLPTVPPSTEKTVQINFPTNQTTILIGQVGIGYNNPNQFPLLLGNYILGGGMVSKLFSIVREKYGLTYGINSFFIPYASNGPFAIGLQTKNDQVKNALKITHEVVANYLNSGPTAEEVDAAKKYFINNFPLTIANNSDIAKFILTMEFYHLPLNYLETYNSKIAAVTQLDIQQAMQHYINPKDFVTITVGKNSAA